MDLFFLKDPIARALERKKTLIVLAILFLIVTIAGMCLTSQPSLYKYHLRLCDRFVTEICYSDTNVFLIFLERTAGHALLLGVVIIGGIHPAAVLLPAAILLYRAFTFGGSLYIFFAFYGFSGGLIVFFLYLPIHLCVDCILFLGTSLSVSRAFSPCGRGDIKGILLDFLALLCCLAAIMLAEMLLLVILFHPIGNIL